LKASYKAKNRRSELEQDITVRQKGDAFAKQVLFAMSDARFTLKPHGKRRDEL